MPQRKRGSRKFNAAVSAEKNQNKIYDFLDDLTVGTVQDNLELAIVEKTLANSRWVIKYYTRTVDKKNNQTIIEHTYQATKAGNLMRKAAPIYPGSIVLVENVSANDTPQFIIIASLDKKNIAEFKKVYEDSYESVKVRLNAGIQFDNKGNALRLFWVDDRIFNAELAANDASTEGVIEFDYGEDEEEDEDEKPKEGEATKKPEPPKKRTYKTITNDDDDLDVDNI